MAFEDKRALWDYVLGVAPREGIYAEFGVWKGGSAATTMYDNAIEDAAVLLKRHESAFWTIM